LTSQEVVSGINAGLEPVHKCYEKFLSGTKDADGMLPVSFVISEVDGSVVSAKIEKESNFSNKVYEDCVLSQIKLWRFPRSRGANMTVTWPISFGSAILPLPIDTGVVNYKPYFDTVKRAIRSKSKYPEEAIKTRTQGVVTIDFEIDVSGALKTVSVLKSSGQKILDEAILNTVKAAAPFSHFPPEIKRQSVYIRAVFNYKLSNPGSIFNEDRGRRR
jgi:TonB family protein